MYKVQRQGKWEGCEGRIVGVSDEALTVEVGGVTGLLPISSVQGWVYDATPARSLEEPVEERDALGGLDGVRGEIAVASLSTMESIERTGT